MRFVACSVLIAISILIAGCGGGGTTTSAPLPPQFSSTPGTSAAEGILYTYSITASDPSGGTVSLEIKTGPTGASLNGNILQWTPSGTQSRLPNAFTITAKSSEGGQASQSWTVTPAGTIHGSRVDTYWTAAGANMVPFDWTTANQTIAALVPQNDGSFMTLTGSGNSDGTFSIPGVPAGFYWLQIHDAYYWTSTSAFDLGSNIAGGPFLEGGICPFCQPTTFDFNISGLDALPFIEPVQFHFDTAIPEFFLAAPANSTTFIQAVPINGFSTDLSRVSTAFFMEMEPRFVGSIAGMSAGPTLTFTNLSLANNQDNPIVGTLAPSPTSGFDLNVQGSGWSPLFNKIGPGNATPIGAYLNMIVEPFLPAQNGQVGAPGSEDLPLWNTSLSKFVVGPEGKHTDGPCPLVPTFTDGSDIAAYAAPILTDQDLGPLLYGDPFPSNWTRFFSICQTATVPVPIPGSNATVTAIFDAGLNALTPPSSLTPLISQVQNPAIEGASLYSANTITTSAPTLTWSAPALGNASGYRIMSFVLGTLPDGNSSYLSNAVYFTRQASITIPALTSNNTYVFVLTALADPIANLEMSPRYSGLPNGFASVVSGPITINSGSR